MQTAKVEAKTTNRKELYSNFFTQDRIENIYNDDINKITIRYEQGIYSEEEYQTMTDIILGQRELREYWYKHLPDMYNNNLTYLLTVSNRNLGKTACILKDIYDFTQYMGGAFLYVVRKMHELSAVQEVCDKYGEMVSGNKWYYNGGRIYEQKLIETTEDGKENYETNVIGYAMFLNSAKSKKRGNLDNPPVYCTFFDEVFTDEPLEKEVSKVVSLMTTINRRLYHVTNNMLLFMAGNEGEGIAPLVETLKMDTNNNKWRSKDCLFYRNPAESFDPNSNLKLQIIRNDIDVSKLNPVYNWSYNGLGFALYQLPNYLYVTESVRKGLPLTGTVLTKIKVLILTQPDFTKPIYIETARCNHILVMCGFRRG